MNLKEQLKAAVISLKDNDSNFEPLALEIFQYQSDKNPIYKAFLENLGVDRTKVNRLEKIPCLPISFFKSHDVITDNVEIQHTFESSGTTGSINSKHHIADLPFYEFLSLKSFEKLYGPIIDYHILALLPNYLERDSSSLVYMVKGFIYNSFSQDSGFYLDEIGKLIYQLKNLLENSKRKILLLGVTFALLDLAEGEYPLSFLEKYKDRLIIMETGGMKGRRKELLREEVHAILKEGLHSDSIHSEYGMTELLSQAYSTGEGFFSSSPSMRVLLREVNDPFTYMPSFGVGKPTTTRKTGGINVIDLANIDSCSFIETQDLGSYSLDYKQFKVLGRFDNSDVRGCNLMAL
ncbi:MAG: acyl transferase [Cytophagales bacterium]|nr:acyl transferase [Cytophagales bacterium]